MKEFLCPICGSTMKNREKIYICKKNHTFDIAHEGYVNLIPPNKKRSLVSGDDKEMVQSRNRFLNKGYYASLANQLQFLAKKYATESMNVLDCGCGEGYYTAQISQGLSEILDDFQIMGIDISKYAVRYASRRLQNAKFAVASSFHLPLASDSVDLLLNCFSPLCIAEFSRVLKKDGVFFYVVPAPKHLWQLKCALYETPYENPLKMEEYPQFALQEVVEITDHITLPQTQDVLDLFHMTPYVWRTPKAAQEKLLQQTNFSVQTDFRILVYKKV